MKKVVKIIDQNNTEEQYEVLCTFESGMTNKNYVIYSGYHEDKDGKLLVQAGSYTEKDGYYDVDTDLTHEEYEMISDVMKNLIDNAEKYQA